MGSAASSSTTLPAPAAEIVPLDEQLRQIVVDTRKAATQYRQTEREVMQELSVFAAASESEAGLGGTAADPSLLRYPGLHETACVYESNPDVAGFVRHVMEKPGPR